MYSHPDQSLTRARPFSALHWRARRGILNAERLGSDLSILAMAHGATCLGTDETVRSHFDRAHLGVDAIALVRFRLARLTSTIAVPTFRAWSRDDQRRLAMSIADAAFGAGRIVLVVSPYDVILQPRLKNAMRIFRSMRPPGVGDADVVRARISADGGTTSLRSCEEALDCEFSRKRIFGLMVGGVLAIDLSTPLGPESTLWSRPAGWIPDWDLLGWPAVRSG